MKYPSECELCNSHKIVACDETEQELSFYCNRCDQGFDIAKTEDDQSRWWSAKQYCDLCGLNKATLRIDGKNSCNECEFNRMKKARGE